MRPTIRTRRMLAGVSWVYLRAIRSPGVVYTRWNRSRTFRFHRLLNAKYRSGAMMQINALASSTAKKMSFPITLAFYRSVLPITVVTSP
jgi:hypothetical protein